MMNEMLPLLLAMGSGGLLGMIFFGGLWLTVRHGIVSKHPALWLFTSLMLRMGITLAGFYFVFAGSWQRLLACLLGFISARLLVTWLTRLRPSTGGKPAVQTQGGNHAP